MWIEWLAWLLIGKCRITLWTHLPRCVRDALLARVMDSGRPAILDVVSLPSVRIFPFPSLSLLICAQIV